MIEVSGLCYTYPGRRRPALDGISFSVKPGEIFGLLGPSGSGKSTTLKVLIGFLREYRGSVRVLGKEARESDESLREQIGVAFEMPSFYAKFTALENLRFFAAMYRGRKEDPMQLLRRVGLEAEADKRVAEFSKGMKIRLNICRAMMHDPDVLFLDEPTSGLDPSRARMIREWILEKKAEGKTIIIATHNMKLAEEMCDRVAFLVDGKIPLIDAPRKLMVKCGKKTVRIEYYEGGEARQKEFPLAGLGRNDEFLRLLRDVSIVRMHTQETTLEDIFIEVTGRRLA